MAAAGAGVLAVVANTDSSFSSWVDWQFGQAGVLPLRTRASNSLPQSAQAYS
jgi:hypothetical protein